MAYNNYASSTTTQVWSTWVDQGTSAMTTTSVSNTVWDIWMTNSTGGYAYAPAAPPTAEQLAAYEAAAVERKRVAAEAKAAREAAQAKALELLRETLNDQQRQEYEKDGYFHVETRDGTRRYRLAPGSQPRRVASEDGRGYAYCIHPDFGYPEGDTVLAQKLLLETDEEAFLRIANARVVALT